MSAQTQPPVLVAKRRASQKLTSQTNGQSNRRVVLLEIVCAATLATSTRPTASSKPDDKDEDDHGDADATDILLLVSRLIQPRPPRQLAG